MSFKYVNIETKEIMEKEEAFEWIMEKSGMSFEDTVDMEKIEYKNEQLEILLEAYFYQENKQQREICKWCEELDETYQRHKEDYLFD